ncbi:hypothetical protein PO909_011347, partial [Leuciscus waleckii]
NQENLVLESDFLLGQELGFGENDYRIVGFERDSGHDEDCSSYNRLGIESDFEDPRDTESEREEMGPDATFTPYLSCRQCGQLLADPLSRSATDESASKTYACKLCSFSSRYSNHLKRHMKTHNGEKPYQCQHCSYASAQLVNLQRHVRTHTGEKPYKCEFCTFACNSLGNLKRHQRMHTQEKELNCGECDFRGNNSHSLKKHMMSHKEDKSTALTEESDPLPELLFPFTCRVCGAVLEDEEGATAQICSKCTLDMLSKSSPTSPEKDDKLYSCTSCPFVTQYPNHLARHCNYASAHFDNLKRHHRVHTGEKPYKCHACDYACGNLANLKRHERIHSGAKPFQCSVCSYSCNQSMNLKRHMLRHTGEKPFKCQECGYTTGHWDNYKRHQKKHGHSAEGWLKMQLPEKEDEDEEGEM